MTRSTARSTSSSSNADADAGKGAPTNTDGAADAGTGAPTPATGGDAAPTASAAAATPAEQPSGEVKGSGAEPTSKPQTGGEKQGQAVLKETDNVVESDPTAVNPRLAEVATAGVGEDAVLIKATGEISGDLFSDPEAGPATMIAQKDIVEEFFFPNTRRPSHRLLYTKGQSIPAAEVEALKARSEAAEAAARAGVDTLVGYTDSSTLASGTGANVEKVESAI